MAPMRIVKSPENGKIIIDLPKEFQAHKKLEVIIMPIGMPATKKKKFNPGEFKGIWKDMDIEVTKLCQEIRDEWERNF